MFLSFNTMEEITMRNFNSPVEQDFIWLAEYADGTHLAEFDLQTTQENSFYEIKRNDIIRFGLIGHGMKLYYEVFGGFFKLAGQMVEIIYKVGDKEYYLTGQQQGYNDIITYKHAASSLDLLRGSKPNVVINQFNFGYKTTMQIDDVTFNFKAICSIPFDEPVFMNFRLVADRELDGYIAIKKNGRIIEELKAPLAVGIGGELNWVVK